MQNTKTKMITVLMLAVLTLAAFPLAVHASLGNIIITNATPAPPSSISAQQFAAGSNIPLNFSQVTWSGGQFYLLISTNGFAGSTAGDFQYTPTFEVANLSSTTYVSQYTMGGSVWIVGNNSVVGPLPTALAGGNYFIKAYDGSGTQAVTDTFFTILGSLSIAPTTGGPLTSVTITGTGFTANGVVNLTYQNPITPARNFTYAVVTANSSGAFVYTAPAPDLLQAGLAGNNLVVQNLITFYANDTTTASIYSVTYSEGARGLMRTGATSTLLPLTNLWGNLTTVAGTVTVSSNFNITGRFFAPGAVRFFWDNGAAEITPGAGVTANGTGFFTTNLVIPIAPIGPHNITIIDANNVVFIITVSVGTSIVLSPSSGNVGITVTVNGYGFPADTATDSFNVTILWQGNATATPGYGGLRLLVNPGPYTNAAGQFTATFVVPHDYGGSASVWQHIVTAYTNDTGVTTASANFTIVPKFAVTFANPMNNTGQTAYGNGTGFQLNLRYTPNMDNKYMGIDDIGQGYSTNLQATATGDLIFEFIDAGFSAGNHVVSLYQEGLMTVAFKDIFTIPNPASTTNDLLQQINQTTTQTNTTVNQVLTNLAEMNATIVSINGTVATINTNVGQIQVDLAAINATIVDVQGAVATVNTNVGTISVNLNAIGANVTSIKGTVATITTTLGTVTTSLTSISATLTTVNTNTATLSSSIGTINTNIASIQSSVSGLSGLSNSITTITSRLGDVQTSLASINGKLDALTGTTASISTALGNLTATLEDIGLTVTDISDGVATIQTDLGTLTGKVDSIEGSIATITTNIGTIQADISALQTDLTAVQDDVASAKGASESLSPLIIVAIVLALVAAVAAIASIVLVRRKIAG